MLIRATEIYYTLHAYLQYANAVLAFHFVTICTAALR